MTTTSWRIQGDPVPLPDVTVTGFTAAHRAQAVELLLAELDRLRAAVPAVPRCLADRDTAGARLGHLFDAGPGIAAVRDGRLVGYLGWFVVEDFRGTGRRAAHCPAWGHAVHGDDGDPAPVYEALYAAAARLWADAGCRTHVVTLLAHQHAAVQAFFRNGFGLHVIDAVRTVDAAGAPAGAAHVAPSGRGPARGLTVRRAAESDLGTLVRLEVEHCRHYARAPILMAPVPPPEPGEIHAVLTDPVPGYWLALHDGRPAGFLRFEPAVQGASPILRADATIAIAGAFVRPGHRGRGLAGALLGAALATYSRAGFTHCSVDFESFNPEARAFWLRTFTPVCLSVVRHPEFDPGQPAPT